MCPVMSIVVHVLVSQFFPLFYSDMAYSRNERCAPENNSIAVYNLDILLPILSLLTEQNRDCKSRVGLVGNHSNKVKGC